MQEDFSARLTTAAQHLSKVDPILAPVIAAAGPCTLQPHANYYEELVRSVVGQQLSVKVAATIWQRFVTLFGGRCPMPEELLTKDIDTLRSVGLSGAKAHYVQAIALHIVDGQLEINKLPELPNDQIMAELTAIKGVGEWTAHMFLMFSLGRLDVLPVGDLGVRTGAMRLYTLPSLPTAGELQALAKQQSWHPYESVASWYIWRSLDASPIS